MKNRNPSAIIGIVVSLVIALWVIIDLLTGNQNKIAGLFLRISVLSFFLGLFIPRIAIYFGIFTTAYIDFFKRLMIVDENLRYSDLFSVLGLTPILVAGIFMHYLLGWFSGNLRINEGQKRLFYVTIGLMALNAFSLLGYGSWQGGMIGGLANMVVYCSLVWTVPLIFTSPEQVEKLFFRMCIIYIPCVLYMFYQVQFGLQRFEIDYLNTGYSLEQRIFGDAELRLFSTMNSAANYSTVVSLLAVCWLAPRLNTKVHLLGLRANIIGLVMFAIFIVSSYFTLSRGGWFCALSMLVGLTFFRRKFSTLVFLFAMCITVLILALSAGFINKSGLLTEATEELATNSSSVNMATRLGTFGGRLDSLYLTLTVPERWTPFGISFAGVNVESLKKDFAMTGASGGGKDIVSFRGKYYSHDGLSDILLRIGYVPMFLLIIFMCHVLKRILFYIEYARSHASQRVFTLSFAAVVGIMTGYIANAEQTRTFPVNFFLYFFCGALGTVYVFYKQQITAEKLIADV